MKKVCVIIPYFGKWPPFLSLFLGGCLRNPDLTFLFFTDLQPPATYPENVKFHKISLEQIRALLDQEVAFQTSITNAYKLCDVRPAYGLIFKNYINGFDFWGWGDVDLIYSNMRKFDLDKLLEENDIISVRSKWITGSFCLLRNADHVNKLFLQSKDLRMIFSSSSHFCFDEISFCWDLAKVLALSEIKFPHDNFTRLVYEATQQGKLTSYFNDMIKESIPAHGYLKWEDGLISDQDGRSYLLYHYVTEKRSPSFKYASWNELPNTFYIDNTGFFSEKQFLKFRNIIRIKRKLLSIPLLLSSYVIRAKRKFL